jgi:hypothetical protein
MEVAQNTSPDGAAPRRPRAADALSKERTKTRKGKARLLTLDALDYRTAAYAAARKLIATLSSDLGGDDQLSEGERQLVTRTALVGAIVSDFEARWVAGQKIELGDYLQACRTQCRLLALLGLQRRPRDVTPTWADLAAEIAKEGDGT